MIQFIYGVGCITIMHLGLLSRASLSVITILLLLLVQPTAAQYSAYYLASGSLSYHSNMITMSSGEIFYNHTKYVSTAGEKNTYTLNLKVRLSLILSNFTHAILRVNFTNGFSKYASSGGYGSGPQQRDAPYDELIQFNCVEMTKGDLIQGFEFQYYQKKSEPNPVVIDLQSSFFRDFKTKLDHMGYNLTLSIIQQNESITTPIGSYNHSNIVYFDEIVNNNNNNFLPFASPLFIITSFVIMIYYKRKMDISL